MNRALLSASLCLLATLPTTILAANTPTAPVASKTAIPDASLTIYNQQFAVVRTTVPLTLTSGVNHVVYSGITSQLEPDSVVLRDPAGKRNLRIIEQNYRGDTISQGLLLSLNEGKTIPFEIATANGAPQIVQGTIIRSGYVPRMFQSNGYQPYYQQNDGSNEPVVEVNGQIEFGLPGKPLFPALTDDAILKPTLDWSIESDKPGPFDAELAYVTEGMTWQAAYNIVAPTSGSDLDLTGWVTISNQTGKQFDNAHIKLMAGDVSKIQQPNYGNGYVQIRGASDYAYSGAPTVTQKSFDEYHLYTIANPTTLRDNETKQVQFLRAAKVASKQIYIYDGVQIDSSRYNGWSYDNIRNTDEYGSEYTTKVAVAREFENTEANGLGVPLPAGRVRFYRRDDDGQLEFVGENDIDHTPKDEKLRIMTGDTFDLTGSRIQTSYKVDSSQKFSDESFNIVLKNHKTEAVEIVVVEHLYRDENWTIPAHSDPIVMKDTHTIEFPISVPAGGEKTITYTAHYTW